MTTVTGENATWANVLAAGAASPGGGTNVVVSSGDTLTLTGATVAGAPTWSSNQAITLSTASQPNVTSLGTLTSLTSSGALTTGAVGVGTGSLVIKGTTSGSTTITVAAAAGSPATWTLPTATAPAGGALTDVAGNGTLSWVVPTAATPTLGAVVNAGNVVNSVGVSKNITWTTGGTFAAGSTSQIYFNTDGTGFISAGTPASAGNGQILTLSGGLANGAGNAGGAINFNSALSGTGTTAATLIQMNAGGTLVWQTGLGSVNPQLLGPSDQTFSIYGGTNRSLYLYASNAASTAGFINLIVSGASQMQGASNGGTGAAGARITCNNNTSPTTGGNLTAAGGSGGTGTDGTGGNFIGKTGANTGAATSDCLLQTQFPLASGTTAQTDVDRDRITSKTKALVNNTATTFCNILLPTSNSGAGVTVNWTVIVSDAGGVEQVSRGSIYVALVNKAGTVTIGTIQTIGTNATNLVTGTDAISFGSSIASTTCSLQVTSNSSLTITTHVIEYRVMIDGGPAVTSSPQ